MWQRMELGRGVCIGMYLQPPYKQRVNVFARYDVAVFMIDTQYTYTDPVLLVFLSYFFFSLSI